jgi:hypothetical protein
MRCAQALSGQLSAFSFLAPTRGGANEAEFFAARKDSDVQ